MKSDPEFRYPPDIAAWTIDDSSRTITASIRPNLME
jgi:hypothetical protein